MNAVSIEQLIASTGFCKCEEITDLALMKTGMTNQSYSFCTKGKKYIIRIPGEGTSLLINRRSEYDVYRSVENVNISEDIHFFDPDSGMKIASFLEGYSPCKADSFDDVAKCMHALRRFHNLKLSVTHTFDLWQQIDYYESLLDGQHSCYPDYPETKAAVLALRDFIEKQPREWTLCHIDSVPDNFLIKESGNGEQKVRLIDWEYAGMQDPHVDIAMFAVYSMYDRFSVDRLIDLYFPEGCSAQTRMKIYCYMAVSGLLWSNWCEFKRKCGVEFGIYAQRQYEYAKEYAAYFQEHASFLIQDNT